jgi:hypothetical protein
MPAGEQPTAGDALSRDQVLDELEFLAAVEHAVLIEQLSLGYAFGHDLPPEDGGATTDQGREAAAKFAMIAGSGAMPRLRAINLGLAEAGRTPDLRRASAVSSPSVAEIALGSPSLAEPQRLLGRQQAIAAAIEERFAALRPAVTSDPLFEGRLLQHLGEVILQDGPNHSALLALVGEVLADPVPAELLRATRREPADAFEDRLLQASDRAYRTFLLALLARFSHVFDEHGATIPNAFFIGRDFQALAERVLDTLDDINRLLVQRGLLPPFRLTVPFQLVAPPGGAPPT